MVIVISPVGRGKFAARIGNRQLCRSSTPFLAAARLLLAEGVDPATTITMRHAGSSTAALFSTIGEAAKLTVHEDRSPRFAKYRPFDAEIDAPPLLTGLAGSDLIGVGALRQYQSNYDARGIAPSSNSATTSGC